MRSAAERCGTVGKQAILHVITAVRHGMTGPKVRLDWGRERVRDSAEKFPEKHNICLKNALKCIPLRVTKICAEFNPELGMICVTTTTSAAVVGFSLSSPEAS